MKAADLQIQNKNFPLQPTQVGAVDPKSGIGKLDELKHNGKAFNEILSETVSEKQTLKFSAHAMRRIENRQIQMQPTELNRLQEGVEQVKDKGAKNSLILVDDMAYIVSVKNKTVVTALDKGATFGNVFTNIDSVAIV